MQRLSFHSYHLLHQNILQCMEVNFVANVSKERKTGTSDRMSLALVLS